MTVINLSKGQGISLAKEAPGLSRLRVGLGWDERATNGQAFDLDASALLLGADNRIRNEKDFVFYNNLSTPNGSVVHQGDNRTGNGDGDDETIIIELDQVDPEIQRIVIIASSHSGDGATPINFGQVQNAYITTYDDTKFNPAAPGDSEIAHYDLSEDVSTETALIFGEVYRHNGDWKFKAVEQGFNDGLAGVLATFGIAAS